MKKRMLAPFGALLTCSLMGQAWVLPGNLGTNPANDYVGTQDANPLIFRTNAVPRMRLLESLPAQTVNGYIGLVDLSGNLGVGQFNTALVNRPFSLLHLDNGGSEDAGFRPWMRTGMTATQVSDLMYVGLKNDSAEINSAVIVWSDNLEGGTIGPDRLRFIFTRNNTGGNAASNLNGLEIARMIPRNTGNEGYLGVGDWNTAGLDPTERLDVLNGRVRLRQLPDDPETEDAYKVMVVDDTADPLERGVVKWVDPAILVTPDCEWTMNAVSPNHVYTAFGTADPNCPDNDEAVGIGVDLTTAVPVAKLNVSTNTFSHGLDLTATRVTTENRGFDVKVSNSTVQNVGGAIVLSGTTTRNRGIAVSTSGATFLGYGADFISGDNASYTVGAAGLTKAGTYQSFGLQGTTLSDASNNFGVFGRADPAVVDHGTTYHGVYGESKLDDITRYGYGVFGRAPDQKNSWAGFFDGQVMINGNGFVNGGTLITSDAQFKTDVQELTNATELLLALRPKTYVFNDVAPQAMNLPDGPQIGFLAQEVEEVLPQLVGSTSFPAMFDGEGVQINEAVDYKALNYVGLIPVLVGAAQEQHTVQLSQTEELAALHDRLDQLEAMLSACCASREAGALQEGISGLPASAAEPAADRKLRIVPNPFSEPPTVFYTLDRAGRMQLIANSADGKELNVLQEATLQAGDYQYAWDTSALAPGMYYVTLLLEGQPIVKKAVKVAR